MTEYYDNESSQQRNLSNERETVKTKQMKKF